MWPKILMQYLPQLVELLPHVSRVVPMADKYLAQRGANDVKLDALGDAVRGDLGKVAKAHIALAEQLDAFSVHVRRGCRQTRWLRWITSPSSLARAFRRQAHNKGSSVMPRSASWRRWLTSPWAAYKRAF